MVLKKKRFLRGLSGFGSAADTCKKKLSRLNYQTFLGFEEKKTQKMSSDIFWVFFFFLLCPVKSENDRRRFIVLCSGQPLVVPEYRLKNVPISSVGPAQSVQKNEKERERKRRKKKKRTWL